MSATFYNKFIKTGAKGFTLRGGPMAKWRFPVSKVLHRKRQAAGPEPERSRAVWSNWNYNAELYAFSKRLHENFDTSLLQQAFIDPSYTVSEKAKLQDLGLEFDSSSGLNNNNTALAKEGEQLCRYYVKSLFHYWYPQFPREGVNAISDFLLSEESMASIGRKLGAYDLIKSAEFPSDNETVRSCLFALIGALRESTSTIQAQLFVNDFIVTQLNGKDVCNIWHVRNPMGFLCKEMEKHGQTSLPESRLIWSTGANQPTAVFVVGLYVDKQFIAKGSGETLDIAEEMAARNGLKRLWALDDDSAPLPFGDKARELSHKLNSTFETLMKTDHV